MCNASAGEYSGFTVIAADSSYFVIALATLVANARYLLMSCALSQRISNDTSIIHRLLLGFFVTDEFFGISISRSGNLNPFYTYGAILIGCPCWAFGSMLGTIAGNLLPLRIVSALSVALFGMFLAIIVPPSRKNKITSRKLYLSALRQVLHLHIFPSSIRLTRYTHDYSYNRNFGSGGIAVPCQRRGGERKCRIIPIYTYLLWRL